jgi:photosystem II stability/assembly factor-like uncharacterized protein
MLRIQSTTLAVLGMMMMLSVQAQYVPQTPYLAGDDAPVWVKMMYLDDANPDAVRAAFDAHYADAPFVKNRDTQFYKRWMRNHEVLAPHPTRVYMDRHHAAAERISGNWEEMGPWSYDPEVAMEFQVQSPGACHVYTVEQAPSNHEVVWCGTATAGAWKTEDHGQHWQLMTRDLPLTSVYSIAIHPIDPDRVWVGSGSGQLWRTSNGGMSWEVCGSSNFQGADRWYRDVIFAPMIDGQEPMLFAATNFGLFRTEDEGNSMIQVSGGEFMELVFHPEMDSICYAIQLLGEGTIFKRSTDGGITFSSGAVGWPNIASGEGQRRCEMAVSPSDPDVVVVLASGSTDDGGGLFGIYKSEDAGQTFEFICCGDGPGGPWEAEINPNILGWSEDGTGDGGQYYYDLALAVSPTDVDRQFAAGICVWRSENGGADWDLNGHWVTWAGEFTSDRYTHADVHDVKFFTRTDGTVDMWVASDGGLYYSADQGDHMEPRMYGLHGTDFWGWQAGWRGPEVMVGGTYHNGTLIRNGDLYQWGADGDSVGGWLAELAGDNFRGFINPGDPTVGYHDGGSFRFTNDRFDRIDNLPFDDSKNPNTAYWFGEYGNLEWDPTCYQCLYSPVGSELWNSQDGGATWSLIHDFGGEKIISVKVSPRDPDRMYVSQKLSGSLWRIHRSTDGGVSWEVATPSPAENGSNNNQPIYLDVDGSNPDVLWCILTGTQNGHKVLLSQDAGDSWQDLTTSTIAGERVVSIAHQRGTDGGVYIGTTQAVYYRDNAMEDWLLYNAGLPMINVSTFVQPDYCGGHIRVAGTRGVHQAAFKDSSSVLAGFMADRRRINLASPCTVSPVHFVSVSVVLCEGVQYEWDFPGGEAAAVDEEEAWVWYQEEGSFPVTLTVTDAAGNSDAWTWDDMIEVVNEPVIPAGGFAENFDGATFPPEHWRLEVNGHAWEQAWDLTNASNGVAQFPNYWVDAGGAEDLLITPAFDPEGMSHVTFDVAHQMYSNNMDGLELWGRAGGDENWTSLWSAYGSELSVPGCYMWFWYDTGGELVWANHEVSLPLDWTQGDVSCLELAFVNIGAYGNHIWIDNVTLNTAYSVVENDDAARADLMIHPNPSGGQCQVIVPSLWLGKHYGVYDAAGRLVAESTFKRTHEQWAMDLPAGIFTIQIEGQRAVRWVIR